MLSKEADSLVTGFDCLDHVPDGSVLSDEVGLAKLRSLVICLTFGCFDDVSKVFILQGIFVLVSGGVLILVLVVVVVGAVLVLLRSTGNWVSVHVVVKLVFHFLLNRRLAALGLNGCELSRVNDAGGCLTSDLI